MIYFVTNKKHQVLPIEGELNVLTEQQGRELFSILEEPDVTGIDSETTGLDSYISKVLLISIGTKEVQFVLDAVSVDSNWFINQLNSTTTWLGHNLKYDYGMFKIQLGLELETLYDTMIAEQRLYANMFDVKTYPFQLDNVVRRNLGYVPDYMNKDIRKEFVGIDPATFVFSNRHITYSAGDIREIFDVRNIQLERIKQYGMEFLINDIEFPLIKVVAEMELEGLDIDKEALRKVIAKAKETKLQKEIELDKIVVKLTEDRAKAKDKPYLNGSRFKSKRTAEVSKATEDLFGGISIATAAPKPGTKIKITKPTRNEVAMNYNSTPEIVKLFGRLNLPLPNDTGKYVIPVLDEKNRILNKYEAFTTEEKELKQFLIASPDSPAREFIKTLLDYRDANGEISKYGDKFIAKIHPITGRIHFVIRQCDALNGRFQSGGGKKQPDKINIQNVKRKKEIRNVFHRKGYSIVTCDLTGAEVTVMADKAKDQQLFDLAMKGKIHKIVATTGFIKILKSRGEEPPEGFEISKEADLEVYTAYKNLTFGGVYGCGAKKAAKTINVSVREGQIYLDNEKAMFPKTFNMVEANVKRAIRQGYLVLNERTKSRIWFPTIYVASRDRRQLEWDEFHEIDGQARNVPISGTQADMVKEAIVEINRFIKQHNLDCALLIQVHDELVYRCPKNMDGVSKEWKANPFMIKLNSKGEDNMINSLTLSFPEFVKYIMIEVANRYLTFIKMGAEVEVSDSWTK